MSTDRFWDPDPVDHRLYLEDKGGEEGEGEEEQRGGVNLIDVVSFDRGVFECIQ